MQPIEIRHALERAGYSQARIARELGRAAQIVHDVIAGKSRSQVVETAIAKILDRALQDVFPQWHGPNRKKRRKPGSVAGALVKLMGTQPPLTTPQHPDFSTAWADVLAHALAPIHARLDAIQARLDQMTLESRRHDG